MIWLIGNKGMLGTEVEALLKQKELACIASDQEVDITNPTALQTERFEQRLISEQWRFPQFFRVSHFDSGR